MHHNFTIGLWLTLSGTLISLENHHLTKDYFQQNQLTHLTTAQASAPMARTPAPDKSAGVIVSGDWAYESSVVEQAC